MKRGFVSSVLCLLTGLTTVSCAQKSPAPASWAFTYPADTKKSGALLDLRSLNEKTAGETGFIKLSPDGNSFVRGDGKPIRFWATVSDGYRLPPEEMARHARFLARLGVNMVRLHTQIAPESGSISDVNQKEIDGIWRFVAACKKEGIYVTLSPYWANDKDATKWGLDGYNSKTGLWGLLFFNEKLQNAYKTWVKALYAPPNPYTGIPLAQEPAVAIVQVQNEDSLLFWTTQGIKPEQLDILSRKFAKWLTQKYGSLAKAKTAWDGTTNEKDDFANGRVGLFNVWHMTQDLQGGLAKRVNDECRFYAETQHQFYADIAAYYKNTLGCKQLINATNWITADPIRLNDIERWTYTANDVLAVNKYTGGVHTGENNGWRIDSGHHFTNQSCLLDPRALPTNLKQVAGHPMLITESTWVSPEGYQAEGPFLMAAYQSLTGVDAFYWFASGGTPEYETNPYFTFTKVNDQYPMGKWTCSTPTLMGGFPANALMFRLGYLKQGNPVVHEERPLADLWQRKIPAIAEDRTFDPNRNTGNTREKSEMQGLDPLAFLVGPVETVYGGDAAKSHAADLKKYVDNGKKIVRSVTGEVTLDYGVGLCTVDAPKAQGVCGFLKKAGGTFTLSDLTIRSDSEYAVISAVAMDNLPLKSSKKVLVQIGTTARPTGWEAKTAEFKSDDGKQTFQGFEVVKTGQMPWRIKTVDATLTLANPGLKKATVLDAAGYPVKEIAGTSQGGKFTLKLPANALYIVLE